jgi:hypothetical protein
MTRQEFLSSPRGTVFTDPDGDICVLLGEGGWRDVEYLGTLDMKGKAEVLYSLVFKPKSLLFAYCYKKEWHIGDVMAQEDSWFNGCKILLGG